MGSAATLLPFPGQSRAPVAAALKRHRLPDALAANLTRESGQFADAGVRAALTRVLTRRVVSAPLNLAHAHAILLIGPAGCGKSTVAAKIVHAAQNTGRKAQHIRTTSALASLRNLMPDTLTVIEAMGFNPLNARAAAAFSALNDAPDVEVVGVLSALSDAEDVADMVRAFHLRRAIVTNLDRTHRLGALLSAITAGASLAHTSNSPHAEDALQTLEPDHLAALLLESAPH